jgi:hypothetical protein
MRLIPLTTHLTTAVKVDGVVRSHRDFRETAIEAARLLQQRNPNAKIVITDLRDGSNVSD